jgi:metallo-beta-lactamase class B
MAYALNTTKQIVTATTVLNTSSTDSATVYQSDDLIIKKLSNHIYIHVSFLNTDDYGKVGCNGMLVVNDHQAVIFDTPTEHDGAQELIKFVTENLQTKILAVIPTHFHQDCIGGAAAFEANNIPIHISNQTMDLLQATGQGIPKEIEVFEDALSLNIGDKQVYTAYFGEGHTKDNIVGYFPEDNVIFGGCLIKKVGASKGYLGDANIEQWSDTVRKLKLKYPAANIIIPGHGNPGGTELLDYTINLFDGI